MNTRDWARYFCAEAHSRTTVWTCWMKQCHRVYKGIFQLPWSISLLAANAVHSSWQQDMLQEVSQCHKWLGWRGLAPSLLYAKYSGRAQRLWGRQKVLHSHVGAEHKPQTAAASEHSLHHIKKPKLENSEEKCRTKYSLIRASEISI